MMKSQVKIDEIDVKILKTLLKDARISFSDIARDCGVSTNAIVKRFYRLKGTGVIVGTSTIVSQEEFRYKFAISIDINADITVETRLLEVLRSLPNMITCYQQVGKHDIHAAAIAKDLEEISRIRDLIKRQKGIKRVGITANIDKRVFFPENLLIQPNKEDL
jgi:DNA-binding Lrp family transcriptional regulator